MNSEFKGRGGRRGGGRPRILDEKKLESLDDIWEKIGKAKFIGLLRGERVQTNWPALRLLVEAVHLREKGSSSQDGNLDDILSKLTTPDESEVVPGEPDEDQD